MMESLLSMIYKDPKKAKFEILERLAGKQMEGWKYDPPFRYFYDRFKDHAFRVLTSDTVASDKGVGIVHQAPAFGPDDYTIAMQHGVISDKRLPPNPVDEYGCFTDEVPDYKGQYVKAADRAIVKHLKERGRIVVDSQITHSYQFCWRSDTPLLLKAIPAWFVKISPIIPQMLENIAGSHWVPSIIKERRFANWISSSPDWNVSRNRFWGTPVPLWVNDDLSEVVCVGSVAELKELSGFEGDLDDIHRDKIDDITIPSRKGGTPLKRIEEVFDCWFESGSMPYASSHYPFENKDKFEASFPGQFIAEGIDQTRGWFYTLLVLGTHLKGVIPFQNCVVNGTVLAEDGKKMSKRLQNYPDPIGVIDRFGSDALRLYMINSPVVRGENLRFKEAGVKEIVQKVLLPLWNSYRFFADQVLLLKKVETIDFMFDPLVGPRNENVMDRWILAKCQTLLRFIDEEMAAYRLYTVVPQLLDLIDSTTNWYIRFNRKRLKGEYGVDDTIHALNTLFEVLFILVRGLAPFIPFLTENIYQSLKPFIPESLHSKDMRSVHFLKFPTVREELIDEVVERRVARMQQVIDQGRLSRERRAIGLKQPLKSLVVIHASPEYLDDVRSLETEICEELNINELVLTSDEEAYNVQYTLQADWPTLGKKLKKDAQRVRKALPSISSATAKEFMNSGKLVVDGIELEREDLTVGRGLSDSTPTLETNSDKDVLTILDADIYPELAKARVAREIVNRVQKLRKKANLVPTDDIKMEYHVKEDPEEIGLAEVFETHGQTFEKALRRNLDKHIVIEGDGDIPKDKKEEVIISEEQEIQKASFLLRLVRL